MEIPKWERAYLRLHRKASVKMLEKPYVYHAGRDELYEIDDKATAFLLRCDGTHRGRDLTAEADFVEYCVAEGIVELLPAPDRVSLAVNEPVTPSLRYLELQLLHRCNLDCLHCYIDPKVDHQMALDEAVGVAEEFASLGGLRLIISGGEPLLHPHLRTLISRTSDLPLRRVLLTNGTLVNEKNIAWLTVDEIQFSLDGWKKGNDMVRGAGSFERIMRGMRVARDAGVAISCATMIHRWNMNEFDNMSSFMEEIGAIEWGIDLPLLAGSLKRHLDLAPSYEEAAPLMSFAYGGGYHGSSDGYACGRHLLTVLPTGRAVKCGFYQGDELGYVQQGLKSCWLRLEHMPLVRLECKTCPNVDECAGGCRFRAPHPLAPDPFMCALYGMVR